jgi:hypothetical protein
LHLRIHPQVLEGLLQGITGEVESLHQQLSKVCACNAHTFRQRLGPVHSLAGVGSAS